MIRAGLNIGNSKISCIVCDYKNSNSIKILSLINIPNNELTSMLVPLNAAASLSKIGMARFPYIDR